MSRGGKILPRRRANGGESLPLRNVHDAAMSRHPRGIRLAIPLAMKASVTTFAAGFKRLRGFARAALVGILTLAAGTLTAETTEHSTDTRWQPPATIAEAARAAAKATTAGDVEAVAVDARLKLARCATPLQTKIERALERGSGTVAVSCSEPTPWRLFVPVRARDDAVVLVLARNMQTGEVLTANDFESARRSSASLPYDYVTAGTDVVGLTLRRTQAAGSVLTAAALQAPEVVRRGELVTLTAGDGLISVKSEGVALEAARLRERLKVRTASGRVIEGTAEAPGQVRVGS
jgi:flagella basal body P-ring formation protein FlgA